MTTAGCLPDDDQAQPRRGCCTPAPNCVGLPAPTTATTSATGKGNGAMRSSQASRSDFAKHTVATLFPHHFTDPESLPPLPAAFSAFLQTYPHFRETEQADRIRCDHYRHLSCHVCLDYSGFGLFSHSQLHHAPTAAASPFFDVSYKLQPGSELESAMSDRIMRFLNLSPEEYTMVYTANRTSAFKLLAAAYPFRSHKRLLTVYDNESEAVSAMTECASRSGAKLMSAAFAWPSLRIQSSKLKKAVESRKKKGRGLFVFPLQSAATGASYPFFWMRIAQENGWHVVLDATASAPKDLDALGLSLIQPDFIVCSFFKVVAEHPSGFSCLLFKKSSASLLEEATLSGMSAGIVSIVPIANSTDDLSGTFFDISIAGNGAATPCCPVTDIGTAGPSRAAGIEMSSSCSSSGSCESLIAAAIHEEDEEETIECEIQESDGDIRLECKGLDHADSLGLMLIGSRLRCITNWLVAALVKLRHANSEDAHPLPLVRIYGPRVKFERGAAVAFNVFDWKGEKVEPALVQKLADRSDISLGYGFLHNVSFADKYRGEEDAVLEHGDGSSGEKRKAGIAVVSASLGFLTDFGDVYRLWCFVAKFLDADFVEKERWRYMALNRKMIEV